MSKASIPLSVSYRAAHYGKGGNLISRQATVEAPQWPACNCLFPYLWGLVRFAVLQMYHKYRVEYAEKKRRAHIPEHFRTGEHPPRTVPGTLLAAVQFQFRR